MLNIKEKLHLSAFFTTGNEQEVRGMLTSILVGNAFFHHSSPSTLFKNEIYKKALNEHTSFHSSGSALPLMVITYFILSPFLMKKFLESLTLKVKRFIIL